MEQPELDKEAARVLAALIDSPLWSASRSGLVAVSLGGTLLASNEALYEKFGYTESEIKGKHFKELTHPEDYEADAYEFARLLKGEIQHYGMHKRYIKKEGNVFHSALYVTGIRDQYGRLLLLLAQLMPLPNGGRYVTTQQPDGKYEIRPTVKLSELLKDNWKQASVLIGGLTLLWNMGKLAAWLGDLMNISGR